MNHLRGTARTASWNPARWLVAALGLLAFARLAGAEPAAVSPAQDGLPDGQALAAELRAQKPAQSLTNHGVLRVRDAKGRRTETPVTVITLVGDAGWQVVYRAGDTTNGPVETLVVRNDGAGRPRFEVARREAGRPEASAPAAVTSTAVPFAGTDFWLCDLGLEFLHWPVQRVAKREISNGRVCWALDSVNPGPGGYASVRSWIDAEYHALLRAEAYDAQRRKVKEFSTGNFKQVTGPDGHEMWFLKDIRIRDEARDTKTELVYRLPGE